MPHMFIGMWQEPSLCIGLHSENIVDSLAKIAKVIETSIHLTNRSKLPWIFSLNYNSISLETTVIILEYVNIYANSYW